MSLNLIIFFMMFSSFTFLFILWSIELRLERVLAKYEKVKGKVKF
jgi:hypothetical protein